MLKEILIASEENYPGISLRALRNKIVFISKVVANRKIFECYVSRLNKIRSCQAISLSPRFLGLVEWPYINNAWDVEERLDVVVTHFEILASLRSPLINVSADNSLMVSDLGYVSPGTRIVIDRAPWFSREGELVLNLFEDQLRVASIAFTFGKSAHCISTRIIVGAIQGIHSGVPKDESLQIYKRLTKSFEGLRPRSLLVEVLGMLAHKLEVKKISAVADEYRHHRHPYFGKRDVVKFSTDYNEIWRDHGGVLDAQAGFYELPIVPPRKTIDEIPSRKRAMYRRRNEILEYLDSSVSNAL